MAPTGEREKKRAELRAKHPETWISVESGDELVGKVTDVTAAWSDVKGDFYPLLTVDADLATGYDTPATLKVHAMPTVLFDEIVRQEVKPGETIKITYVGTRKEARIKGQNAAEVFRVVIHGRNPDEVAEKVYASMRDKVRSPRAPEVPAEPLPVVDDLDDIPLD